MTGSGLSALEVVDGALDPGGLTRWDEHARQPFLDDPARTPWLGDADREAYDAQLARATRRSGVDEAVVTGEGRIDGRPVAIVACEFGFLAGSIGVAAAGRIVRAVERATREGLPLLATTASGGTRMQEGTPAFLGMVPITDAIARHKRAGLPYLSYLRHPTTGGVLASWGSLAHVTVAEPGALVGFLGPRVYEVLHGETFPEGVQVAENLLRRGLIDAVAAPPQLRALAGRALTLLTPARRPDLGGMPTAVAPAVDARWGPEPPDVPAWDSIRASRRERRPGIRRFLRTVAEDVVPLSGSGQGEVDPGLLVALARIGGASCVVLGQDRRAQSPDSPMGPHALREARRGIRIAGDLRLPLLTVIDTPGAALSREAEEGGMAHQIARCLADLVSTPTPTVSVLLGQGTGGGALALVPADRVIAAQHAWLSPLPPEGAAAIVHRDAARAPELAATQGVRSLDLVRAGIVDHVVLEHDDAADEPDAFCARLADAVGEAFTQVLALDPQDRLARRRARHQALTA